MLRTPPRIALVSRARHRSVLPGDAMFSGEGAGAEPTGEHSGGFAIPVVKVPGRAGADPGRKFVGDRSAMKTFSFIAEVVGYLFPLGSVTGARSGNGVRDLMQQDLVDFVILISRSQILGHGDALVGVVAEARPRFGVVEGELPLISQMNSDEGIRPHAHSGKVSHL